MSASREKKQRQNAPDQGLTQKQIKERKEAAIQKRNHTIYAVVGVVAAVLVAALLIWDAGFIQRGATAMTVNGRNYSAAEVSYYYGQARQQYSMYLQMMGYDSSKSDREQIFDETNEQSYFDFFMEGAKSSMIQITALADAAREAGETLTDESKASVDEAMETYKSQAAQYGYPMKAFLKANFGKYMTESVLRSCLEETALANQYYSEHSDSLTYDDAALQGYYDENADSLDTFVYDVCFVNGKPESKTDDDGNTVEATDEEKQAAMDTAKEAADALADAVKGGESFDVQANLTVNKVDGSTYGGESTSVGSSVLSVYRDWLTDSARKEGDVTVIESEGSGYYVVRFGQRYLDEESMGSADIRHILVKAEVAEGADEPTDEAMDAAKAKAQSILDEFNAGDKTGEAFGELAKANSEDPGSKDNGGLYENVTPSTSFFADFINWIFADGRQEGDTGLVENTQSGQQGWHVMYLNKAGPTQWKYTAGNALRSADLQTWLEGLQEGYEATEGSGLRYVG